MVYKYYSCEEYNIDALQQRYFFFSKAERLNDPYDTSWLLASTWDFGKTQSLVEIYNQYGICSFSRTCTSMHLWALYASQFSGFVVEFDDTLFDSIQMRDLVRVPYWAVNYVEAAPDFTNPNMEINLIPAIGAASTTLRLPDVNFSDPKSLENIFMYLCTIKDKHTWGMEEENRLVLCGDAQMFRERLISRGWHYLDIGYKIPMPENCVNRIIVGHNFSEERLSLIKKIARGFGLTEIQKTKCVSPFSIDFELIQID